MHVEPLVLRLLGALSLLRKKVYLYAAGVMLLVLIVASLLWLAVSAPPEFPKGEMVRIESGQPLSVIGAQLQAQGVIRSSLIFTTMLRLIGKDSAIDSGIYIFEQPTNMFGVALRMVRGEFGFVASRITFTEGMTVREMASVIQRDIPDFDMETFVADATELEGYLFPDTYFFMPDVTPEEVIERAYDRFTERIGEVQEELHASPLTLDEAVILASILEKEGRSFEVRQRIAGILMNRLEEDMPLQVDAVFGYIYGRDTYSPSFDDLESNSPYNTYRYRGLPPGAINNPGIEAIRAALTPISSDYFYYLTDNDGVMRYARTFEEHRANRERYGI